MNQEGLFENPKLWEDEWQDMPEYEQSANKPFQQIRVNFATKEDVDKFSELIGAKLSYKADSIWFPFKQINIRRTEAYYDEDE